MEHNTNYDDETVWHLVDSNENLTTIPPILQFSLGKIIQAASSELNRHHEWVKQRNALTWWMSPPAWQEIYVAVYINTSFDCGQYN